MRIETARGASIVEDVSLELRKGEILGLVGESGSGKTTLALSLLGYVQSGVRLAAGEIRAAGEALQVTDAEAMRALRGRVISYVPQNPGTALNPSLRIGPAIEEMVRAHQSGNLPEGLAGDALGRVGLPGSVEFQRRYPHELSGGQQQRVCISIALVGGPPVVVLDEPTTGLDVVTQALILEELLRLRSEQGIAMLYVTHDLAVVSELADRIAVMYGGRIIEQGPARELLRSPRHPYTHGLLQSIPDHVEPAVLEPMPGRAVAVGERPQGCSFAPRCSLAVDECRAADPPPTDAGPDRQVRCFRSAMVGPPVRKPLPELAREPADSQQGVLRVEHLRAVHHGRGETVVCAEDVNLEVPAGRCVALVGESGSGKTTIARTIAGLHPIAGGQVLLDGESLAGSAKKRTFEQRRRIQIVFQNPATALNPRHTAADAIRRPIRLLRSLSDTEARSEVARMLEIVRLPSHLGSRYPMELSGGERQRVCVARALAAKPDVIICDEITSALDVSVQAAVLDLLSELREALGLAVVFVTHDLGVVSTIADSVLVLDRGRIVESGPTGSVLVEPRDEYTKRLLDAAPSIAQALKAWDAEHPASAEGESSRVRAGGGEHPGAAR